MRSSSSRADRLTILPFKGDPAAKTATVRTEVKREQRHAGAGQLQPARDAAGLEGLGRHDRRHFVREELPDRLRRRNRAEGHRCRDPAARGAECVGQAGSRAGARRRPSACSQQAAEPDVAAFSIKRTAPDRLEAQGAICFERRSAALQAGLALIEREREHDDRPGEGHRSRQRRARGARRVAGARAQARHGAALREYSCADPRGRADFRPRRAADRRSLTAAVRRQALHQRVVALPGGVDRPGLRRRHPVRLPRQ